jgi:hypothetical protein
MITYVFGEDAVNKRYLRIFIESARRSGIDVAVVGDPLPFIDEMPPNVRHVLVTWDDLVDRVKNKIFHGKEPGPLREKKHYYKIVDFKPLFAYLFPEQVEGYDWWGHLDNDAVLGDVRQFLGRDRLFCHDVISGIPNAHSWGPFMLYRNTPIINRLFFLAKRPLEEIFATGQYQFFDEWGGGPAEDPKGPHYESTMSGILERFVESFDIRWDGGVPMVWDGDCLSRGLQESCQCSLIREEFNKQTLVQSFDDTEVAICHFQHSKKIMEESLADDSLLVQLLEQGQFNVNFSEGFMLLNATKNLV